MKTELQIATEYMLRLEHAFAKYGKKISSRNLLALLKARAAVRDLGGVVP